jgi:hypothetical protein
MENIEELLKGGDLRSLGQSKLIVSQVSDQESFDKLYKQLFHKDRLVVMRAADVIEKITLKDCSFLVRHSSDLVKLTENATNKELKWHLSLLTTRVTLTNKEAEKVWQILARWATDKKESRIVRVNALQGLFNLLLLNNELTQDFNLIVSTIIRENIPSILARLRKLKIMSK